MEYGPQTTEEKGRKINSIERRFWLVIVSCCSDRSYIFVERDDSNHLVHTHLPLYRRLVAEDLRDRGLNERFSIESNLNGAKL